MRRARATVLLTVFVSLLASTRPVAQAQAPEPQRVDVPQAATTLEGIPTVRVDATQQGATRRLLDAMEREKSRLTIQKVDGKYVWTSRDNKRLTLFNEGPFTYLSAAPGQYIRFTRVNDRITYVEHIDSPIGTVTWYGELRVVLGRK